MRILFALLAFTVAPMAAHAGDIAVMLKDAGGQPVADAVVTFVPAQGAPHATHFAWPMVMAQHNIAFEPHVLVAPLGADVSFPNQDTVRHHVYSFSPTKRFELKLYGREQARTVHFDKAGVVALGCNIHDRMAGFIVVVDTPFASKTDANGRAVIADVPDGAGMLGVWQEDLKAPGNALTRPLAVRGETRQSLSLDMRPHAPMKM